MTVNLKNGTQQHFRVKKNELKGKTANQNRREIMFGF
jgi:hypothetical protein